MTNIVLIGITCKYRVTNRRYSVTNMFLIGIACKYRVTNRRYSVTIACK